MNESSRLHLVIDALERVAAAKGIAFDKYEYAPVAHDLTEKLKEHLTYIWEHGEDMPEIRNWSWTGPTP